MIDYSNLFIKFKKTHPDAVLPVRKHPDPLTGDTGYDLTAVEDVVILKNSSATVPVGLVLADISPGIWFTIRSRSGLKFKHNANVFHGTIDNNYRGDLGVLIENNSSSKDLYIKKGDRVGQIALYPLIVAETEWADEVSDTSRGANGFGSTGR